MIPTAFAPRQIISSAAINAAFGNGANALDFGSVFDYGVVGDGLHDDTTALQAALNACAGRCSLTIPAGATCLISRRLLPPSNTEFIINGTIFLAANSNCHMIFIASGVNTVIIRGIGTLDGNRANNSGSNTGDNVTYGAGGIVTQRTSYPNITNKKIRIRDITIQNVFNWPISIYNATDVITEGTFLTASGNAPQYGSGTNNSKFVNNTVDFSTVAEPDYGFAFYWGCSYCGCEGNVFRRTATIGVLADGALVSPPDWNNIAQHDITIANNKIVDSTNVGITVATVVSGTVGFPEFPYKISLVANIITNSANGGIGLSGVYDCLIEANIIDGGGGGPFATGSWNGVAGLGARILLKGNIIKNGGSGGTGVVAAAIDVANFSDMKIIGNYIYDDQSTPTMQNAFTGVLYQKIVFWGNFFGPLAGLVFNAATVFQADTVFVGTTTPNGLNLQFNQAIDVLGGVGSSGGFIDTVNNGANSNNISMRAAAVGATPTISVFGTGDPNVSIAYFTKGDGSHQFNGTICGNNGVSAIGALGAGNHIGLDGAAAGSTPVITSFGTDTNISLTINAKGTGKIDFGSLTASPPLASAASCANDAAAAAAGYAIGDMYRNGSVIQIRVS